MSSAAHCRHTVRASLPSQVADSESYSGAKNLAVVENGRVGYSNEYHLPKEIGKLILSVSFLVMNCYIVDGLYLFIDVKGFQVPPTRKLTRLMLLPENRNLNVVLDR